MPQDFSYGFFMTYYNIQRDNSVIFSIIRERFAGTGVYIPKNKKERYD